MNNQLIESTEEVPANLNHSYLNNTGSIKPSSDNSDKSCPTCSANQGPVQYIYAMGEIEWRFSSLSLEKEFMQVADREQLVKHDFITKGEAFYSILKSNRHLARNLCKVFRIKNMDAYLLIPRDPADIDTLVESIRTTPDPSSVDIVIGTQGPIAPRELCNGIMVPVVFFDQTYSFNRPALIGGLMEKFKERKSQKNKYAEPEFEKILEKDFQRSAEETFDMIIRNENNLGGMDEDRAINYLAVRYDEIYMRTAIASLQGNFLKSIETSISPLTNTRKIVDVIFSYSLSSGVIQKYSVSVDVTEMYPFLVAPLSPYYVH